MKENYKYFKSLTKLLMLYVDEILAHTPATSSHSPVKKPKVGSFDRFAMLCPEIWYLVNGGSNRKALGGSLIPAPRGLPEHHRNGTPPCKQLPRLPLAEGLL